MSETGVIKFTCEHQRKPLARFPGYAALRDCRARLRELGLVGLDPSGIAFGNISLRQHPHGFIITGSGTGGKERFSPADCARVTACDFGRNWLRCEGEAVASSESLTHAAIYEAAPRVGAIIHGHALKLWTLLLDRVPATDAGIEYGTPAMAAEVQRLLHSTRVTTTGLFAMAGHEGGLISFGATLQEALKLLLVNCARRPRSNAK